MQYLSALLIAMFMTIVLIPLFKAMALKLHVVDIPDARKVHTKPIARIGGVAMALGALLPILLWAPPNAFRDSALIGAWILVLFGLLDDRKSLDFRIKFASQIAAALIVIFYGGLQVRSLGALLPANVVLPEYISIPLTLVIIVGVTNAINLADGLDGLAGGITLLSFICVAYLAYRSDMTTTLVFSLAVSGAIFGFLRYNTYPAVVFMGDAGSQFIGFLAITLSIRLTQNETPVSPLVPLLLLGLPVLDTLMVMRRRVMEGKSPFYPDKNHLHHKMMRLGFSHSESVLIIYFLQVVPVAAALYLRYHSEWLLLIFWLIFAGLLSTGIYLGDRTGWQYQRHHLIDRFIQGRLKWLKEKYVPIKFCFGVIRYLIPALLLATCCFAVDIPNSAAVLLLALAAFILAAMLVRNSRLLRAAIRLSLYLSIPFLIYYGEAYLRSMNDSWLVGTYHLAFIVLVVFVILTLRLSRREGFKSTPMDFLILFIAVVVPNLTDENLESNHMGMVAVKIIVFFFSYEVLIGELRGKLYIVGGSTVTALTLAGVLGLVL